MYTGELVRLREYREGDIERTLTFVNDPEVARNIQVGVMRPNTLKDETDWVHSQTSSSDTMTFAIETLEGGLYIGGCGLNKINWKNRSCNVGIMIGDSDYQGRGYGTDAMRVLLRYCFGEMNLNRVELDVFSSNARAIRCYEKVGFVREGVRRQMLYRDFAYHDEAIMAVLSKDFLLANNLEMNNRR